MFVKLRRVSFNRGCRCDYCRCSYCRKRVKAWRKLSSYRKMCRDGSIICSKCYSMPCDPHKGRWCQAFRKDKTCSHRPVLADGEIWDTEE